MIHIITLLLLVSCLPSPPDEFTAKLTAKGDFGIEVYEIIQDEIDIDDHFNEVELPEKNLLFIALDDTVATSYSKQIQSAYKTDKEVRIEDVAWWRFSKFFKGVYNKVVRIPHNNFTKESLFHALELMEKMNAPYDLYLLTHGIPNHITTVKGAPFVSYKDIQQIAAKFVAPEFVYMQGCFSNSLAYDWLDIGVQDVLAFDGWNRNFFYIEFFLRNYQKYPHNVSLAHEVTNRVIEKKMRRSFIYRRLIKEMGTSFDKYFEISPNPEHYY
jgi:hypothetical protein